MNSILFLAFATLLLVTTSCSQLIAMEWFPKTDTSKMAEFGEKTDYKVLPEECSYGQVMRDGKCVDCKSDDECVNQYPESKFPGATGTCNETKQKDGTTIKRCGCPLINAGLMCGAGLVCDENERYCRFCTSDDECLVAYGSENICDKRSGGQGYCVGKDATTGVSQQFGVHLPCDEMDKIKDPRYKKYVAEECKKLYSGLPKANPSQLPSMGRPSVLPSPQYQAPKPVDIWGLRNVIDPKDVAVDSKGQIYVTDFGISALPDRVQIFDQSGKIKNSFLVRKTSTGLNCDPKLVTIGRNDKIHIVCHNDEIQIYDSSFKLIKAFNATPNVYDLDVHALGDIYIASSSTNKINVYDTNGKYLRSFGKLGTNAGEITAPRSIAIDNKRKHVYVLSNSRINPFNQIQRFDLSGNFIRLENMAADEHYYSIAYDESLDVLYASTWGYGIVPNQGHLSCCNYDNGGNSPVWGNMTVFAGKYLYAINVSNSSLMAIDVFQSLMMSKDIYLWTVGLKGNATDKVEFDRPRRMVVSHGSVFVIDEENDRILKIDPKNQKILMVIGDKLTSLLVRFSGIAVNKNGDIYAADESHGEVRIYDSNGQLKKTFSALGGGVTLDIPTYVMTDAADYVYVIDESKYSISVFDANGNFITSLGKSGSGDGEFKFPVAMTTDTHGNIAVLDCLNNRVQFFTSQYSQGKINLQYKAKISIPGVFKGGCAYRDIAIDGNDLIYVVDRDDEKVKVFDINGKIQFEFGTPIRFAKNTLYKEPGDFIYPEGITIDRATGTIYVTDLSNVHVFKR